MRYAAALLFTLGSLAPVHAAENWPQWRGPNAAGIAGEGNYPVEFSGDEGVVWKVDVPGVGSSSPVVWEDSIFVTTSDDKQDTVLCLSLIHI